MAYLVTGGTGFIGSYVVRDLLQMGEEVVCYQRSGITPLLRELVPQEHLSKVKIVQASVADTLDLFDAVRKHNVDTIVHLSYSLYPESEIAPISLRVNVIGTNNVFEAARLFGLKKVVWTSSSAVFGRVTEVSGDKVMTEENIVYQPTRMYGATKALCEFMAKMYYDQFGVNIIGFRLVRTYGVGKLKGSAAEFTELLQKVALNQPTVIRNGDDRWTYAGIEDVARAMIKACQIPTTKTRIFNLMTYDCNGWELAEIFRKINPAAQIKVEPGVGVYSNPRLDVTALYNELGFAPLYSFEEGIRRVLNHFRKQKGLSML